jgi:hypothetical protein
MVKLNVDTILRDLLKQKPDHMYIPADGSALYVLVPDDWETVLEFTGPDFSVMSDEDVNDYIVETLNKLSK